MKFLVKNALIALLLYFGAVLCIWLSLASYCYSVPEQSCRKNSIASVYLVLSSRFYTLRAPLRCGKSLSVNDLMGFAVSVVSAAADAFKVQSQPWLVLGSASGAGAQEEFIQQQYSPRSSAENSSS